MEHPKRYRPLVDNVRSFSSVWNLSNSPSPPSSLSSSRRASNNIHFRFRVRLTGLVSGPYYREYSDLEDVVLHLLLDKVLLRMIRPKRSLPLPSPLVLQVFVFWKARLRMGSEVPVLIGWVHRVVFLLLHINQHLLNLIILFRWLLLLGWRLLL